MFSVYERKANHGGCQIVERSKDYELHQSGECCIRNYVFTKGHLSFFSFQNGVLQGFIYTLLLTASAKITKDLDMAPGGEFRNAFNEAVRIPGCSVLLGDRPVDITLRRAISTLSAWQKVKMTYNCVFSSEKLDHDELEKFKKKDVLEV